MIVGIDLGTTNSLIAYWKDGAAHLVPNSLGDTLTPSCVSLDEDGTTATGSCVAACTKVTTTNVAGACCSCGGVTKKFVKAAWNNTTFLCQ